jgi:hypothetical protein
VESCLFISCLFTSSTNARFTFAPDPPKEKPSRIGDVAGISLTVPVGSPSPKVKVGCVVVTVIVFPLASVVVTVRTGGVVVVGAGGAAGAKVCC